MGMGFFQQKEAKIPDVHKIGSAISRPQNCGQKNYGYEAFLICRDASCSGQMLGQCRIWGQLVSKMMAQIAKQLTYMASRITCK